MANYVASVPVVLGDNVITVRVIDNAGNVGTDGITVTRGVLVLEDIVAGSKAVFEESESEHFSVTSMDSTHAIVVYQGDSNTGTAYCLTLSGTTITVGNVANFTSNYAITGQIDVTSMDSTRAIAVYRDSDGLPSVCCLTLSGTTITASSSVVASATVTLNYLTIESVDSSHAILAYGGTSSTTGICCLSLSGTTITAGAEVTITGHHISSINMGMLGGGNAILAFTNNAAADGNKYLYSCCLSLSGTTISKGSEFLVSASSVAFMEIVALSLTKAIIFYGNGGGLLKCLSLSGTTITAGVEVSFNGKYETQLTKTTETQALVKYTHDSNQYANYLNLSGTAITTGTEVIIGSGEIYRFGDLTTMDDNHAILVTSDYYNTEKGTAICLTLS